jgi:hypothetical protein
MEGRIRGGEEMNMYRDMLRALHDADNKVHEIEMLRRQEIAKRAELEREIISDLVKREEFHYLRLDRRGLQRAAMRD